MKILILTNKVPYPAHDGSSIAMASIISGLLQNKAQVSVLSLNTAKHYKNPEAIEKALPKGVSFNQVYTDNRLKPVSAFLNLLSGAPYHVSRFEVVAFALKLTEILEHEDFDVVQLEGLSMAVYEDTIRQCSTAKIVMRAHNVESQIWQRQIVHEKNWLNRAYLKLQVKRLARFEKQALDKIDAVVCITENDQKIFETILRGQKITSIPCGIDLPLYKPCNNDAATGLGHLASFDWLPNQQGAKWFLDEVWPLVLKKQPDAHFKIAGRNMPDFLKNNTQPGVEVLPDVEDMRSFICGCRMVVVPLLAGSGMRIKVLENMALGACQISTSIGAEGIEVKNGRDILLADTPEEMARKITALMVNEDRIRQIGKNARKTVSMHYSNKELGNRLLEFYETRVC